MIGWKTAWTVAINLILQSYQYIGIHWTTLFNDAHNIFTLSNFFSSSYSLTLVLSGYLCSLLNGVDAFLFTPHTYNVNVLLTLFSMSAGELKWLLVMVFEIDSEFIYSVIILCQSNFYYVLPGLTNSTKEKEKHSMLLCIQ